MYVVYNQPDEEHARNTPSKIHSCLDIIQVCIYHFTVESVHNSLCLCSLTQWRNSRGSGAKNGNVQKYTDFHGTYDFEPFW